MSPAKKSAPNERGFIRLIQKREASISIGASTARRMPKNTVKKAREFLQAVDLRQFVTGSEKAFRKSLDASTEKLMEKLPKHSWGAARKFLNIFLRGAFYNRYLYEHYDLDPLEFLLEVPLDKSVATGLKGERHGETLPPFNTILNLDRKDSAAYQVFSLDVARKKRCARVHLDLWYFRREVPTR
jgi:hypothetical protein